MGQVLVLDSAFISGREIATDIYPFIPGFLVGVDFPVNEDLRRSGAESHHDFARTKRPDYSISPRRRVVPDSSRDGRQ